MVFASSLYCWAFSVPKFARIWAQKLKLKPAFLSRHLWGNFVFNAQNLSISRYTPENKSKPMFVAMVLDPIWQLYEAAVLEENLQKVRRMIKKLDLVSFGSFLLKTKKDPPTVFYVSPPFIILINILHFRRYPLGK